MDRSTCRGMTVLTVLRGGKEYIVGGTRLYTKSEVSALPYGTARTLLHTKGRGSSLAEAASASKWYRTGDAVKLVQAEGSWLDDQAMEEKAARAGAAAEQADREARQKAEAAAQATEAAAEAAVKAAPAGQAAGGAGLRADEAAEEARIATDGIREALGALGDALSRLPSAASLAPMLSELDLRQQDVLHKIEMGNFSASGGYMLAEMLHDIRRKRRAVKNGIAIREYADGIAAGDSAGKFLEMVRKRTVDAKYVPRVLDGLFA